MNERLETKKKTLGATMRGPETVSMKSLSVVVLGSNEEGRRTLTSVLGATQARVVKEAPLPGLDLLAQVLEGECDVLIIDLNQDTELGLDLVETACSIQSSITVMVYSRKADPEIVVRSMRVGAREFLSDPLSAGLVDEALVRASARRDEGKKKALGKPLVFVGAKGGSGVTTIASNFAVALANESGQNVALVDLNLQLGDAALGLGLSSEYSTLDALQNEARLDSELLATLLVKHASGLHVLAAPDEPTAAEPTVSGVRKLVNILRNDFAWIVIDANCHYADWGQALFDMAEKVYLVTQVSVAELRNSNRIISANFTGENRRKLEVVLNRFAVRAGEIDEQSITKALTVPAAWKVPGEFQVVRSAQNAASPLVSKDSAISRVLLSMARAACGKTATETKKRRFGLFA